MRFIDDETHRMLSRSALRENDVLLSIAGALGRSALIAWGILPANVNQALAIIRPARESRILSSFLLLTLRGRATQRQINDMRVELAQANISLQQVRDLRIVLPPQVEQRAIAGMFDSIDEAMESGRRERDSLNAMKASAADALLTGRLRTIAMEGTHV